MTKYSSPLLSLPGACTVEGEQHQPEYDGVAWHYGDPLVEQRFYERGKGYVDLSHRVVLSVSGPDAPTFLNNLFSQKLDDLEDGQSTQALDLDGQGHILHHMGVAKDSGVFYLDVAAPQADSLEEYLRRMVFWSQVEITRTDLAYLQLVNTDLPQAMLVDSRRRALVPRSELSTLAHDLIASGAHAIGLMAYTAQRVQAYEPELGIDMDEKSIPHESPVLLAKAVHLHKGCYRGQETVARVDNLGRSPRVVVMVHLDGSAPTLPEPATPLTSGGRTVGRLGTVVHDMDLGPIGLALVKRSALGATDLVAGEASVAIDPDSIPKDDGVRPGRAAINKLKGL